MGGKGRGGEGRGGEVEERSFSIVTDIKVEQCSLVCACNMYCACSVIPFGPMAGAFSTAWCILLRGVLATRDHDIT